MSYCVNCGVELSDSEKYCPLCDTEVINPRKPWKEPGDRPYPQTLDAITRHIDRRFVASLLTAFLAIPVFVAMLCNLITGRGITWSMYVLGAGVLIFTYALFPLYFRRYHQLTFIALDGVVTLAYLKIIELNAGGGWFLPLGLPLTGSLMIIILLLAFLFRRTEGSKTLKRTALILEGIGVYAFVIEIFTDLFVLQRVSLSWSPYVVISCIMLAFALLLVERRNNLKEEIRKRLFY